MAYQIKKQKNIVEDLELLADDGSIALTIHIDINPEKIANDVRKVQLELVKFQKSAAENKEEALENLGKTVCSVFNLICGEENTAKILEYFNGKYACLLYTSPSPRD